MEDRVKEEIRSIMKTHKPDSLSDKVVAELERLKLRQKGNASETLSRPNQKQSSSLFREK